MKSLNKFRSIALGAGSLLALISTGSVLAAETPILISRPAIEVAGSKGTFDFLEVDPGRHRLLAAHEKNGTADFFDLDTNRVLARVKVGPAVGIAVDPKTGRYFVSVQDDRRVAIIDPVSLREIKSVAVGGETDAILFNPTNRSVYVTQDNGARVWVISADSETIVATISVPGAGPESMTFDVARDRIYLNIKTTNEVVVIDTKANAVVAHWPTAPAEHPHGLAFNPTSSRLFSAGANGKLVVIDVKTGKAIASVNITAGVDQAAIDATNRRIYCTGANWMSVVEETAEGAVFLGNVKTAATAENVAVDPNTHAVWTTYTDGKNAYAKSWMLPRQLD